MISSGANLRPIDARAKLTPVRAIIPYFTFWSGFIVSHGTQSDDINPSIRIKNNLSTYKNSKNVVNRNENMEKGMGIWTRESGCPYADSILNDNE